MTPASAGVGIAVGPTAPLTPRVEPAVRPVSAEFPAGPRASSLDVEDLVADVQAQNPSLQALVFAWQAAVQRYPQVVSLEDPMFMAMFAPQSVSSTDMETGYVLEASQKLPWFGKRGLRGGQAEATATMAAFNADDYRRQLASVTRTAYYDYFLVHQQKTLIAQNRELVRQFLETAQAKYRANLVTQQDVLQADLELADLERRSITLDRSQLVAVARINTLLRRPANALLPPPATELRTLEPPPEVATLEQLALRQRADLAALAAQVHEAEVGVELASKDYFPDVEFFGRYDTFWQPSSTMGDLRGQAGMRLNLPLYRQRLHAAYNEAQLRLQQRRAEYDQKLLDVTYEVQSSYAELRESQRIVALYESRFVPLAEQSLRAAQTNYEVGKGTFLELLMASRKLVEARQMKQEALAMLHSREAALRRAVGSPVG